MQLLNKHDSKILENKHVQKSREFKISTAYFRETTVDNIRFIGQNIYRIRDCLADRPALGRQKSRRLYKIILVGRWDTISFPLAFVSKLNLGIFKHSLSTKN